MYVHNIYINYTHKIYSYTDAQFGGGVRGHWEGLQKGEVAREVEVRGGGEGGREAGRLLE